MMIFYKQKKKKNCQCIFCELKCWNCKPSLSFQAPTTPIIKSKCVSPKNIESSSWELEFHVIIGCIFQVYTMKFFFPSAQTINLLQLCKNRLCYLLLSEVIFQLFVFKCKICSNTFFFKLFMCTDSCLLRFLARVIADRIPWASRGSVGKREMI